MVLAITQQISQGKAIELPDEILDHLGVRPGDKVDQCFVRNWFNEHVSECELP